MNVQTQIYFLGIIRQLLLWLIADFEEEEERESAAVEESPVLGALLAAWDVLAHLHFEPHH